MKHDSVGRRRRGRRRARHRLQRWRRQDGRHHPDPHDRGRHHDRRSTTSPPRRRRPRPPRSPSTRSSSAAAAAAPPAAASGKEVITMAPADDGSLRVDFSEDEVAGLGDQSRAASWSAVTVATLLTGAPLEGRYRFEITGPIDGPSAGALKTVAVLSLMRGDTLDTRHHDDRHHQPRRHRRPGRRHPPEDPGRRRRGHQDGADPGRPAQLESEQRRQPGRRRRRGQAPRRRGA